MPLSHRGTVDFHGPIEGQFAKRGIRLYIPARCSMVKWSSACKDTEANMLNIGGIDISTDSNVTT